MKKLDSTLVAAGYAVAAALTIGCGQGQNDKGNQPQTANQQGQSSSKGEQGQKSETKGTSGTSGGADKTPMTVTGCLQETKGITGSYLLTQANAGSSGSAPVGTSGSSSRSEVEQKQMMAAKKSFQLSGETDELKNLVGHRIRVIGVLSSSKSEQGQSSSKSEQGQSSSKSEQGQSSSKSEQGQSSSKSEQGQSSSKGQQGQSSSKGQLPTIDVITVNNVGDACETAGKATTGGNSKSKR
jgi:hypothetical protein